MSYVSDQLEKNLADVLKQVDAVSVARNAVDSTEPGTMARESAIAELRTATLRLALARMTHIQSERLAADVARDMAKIESLPYVLP